MTGPGGENVKMKGKKFIAIMAIFIILCSIQAISALEDNNVTQTDVQPTESNTLGISEVIASDIQSNESQVQNNDANDKTKLRNLFVVFFNDTPIIPPIVVPNVPKNKPIKVALNKKFINFPLIY